MSTSGTTRYQTTDPRRVCESGAALVEFALVLPVLLILVMGIIDFGLYFYNDLQLTQVARDAARYASVGNVADASSAITNARLVSTTLDPPVIDPGTSGNPARVTLTATYTPVTPLPSFVGIGSALAIDATAIMRRE
ncbi:MAG: pilus assembly protein [Thermoleophilia bacterium]|nr:pilus assembly protein [Thermoleophilia bacterium]